MSRATASEPGRVPDQAPAAAVTPRLVMFAVRRHFLLLLLAGVVAGGAGAAVWFYLPLPKWTASVVFHVSTTAPVVLNQTADTRGDFYSYRASQAALARSKRTLSAAMKEPELSSAALLARPDAVEFLQDRLQIDFSRGHEYMRVAIEGDEPDELKSILNGFQKTYLTVLDGQDRGARRARLAQLKTKYDEYQLNLKQLQDRIDAIANTLGSKDGAMLAVIDSVYQDEFRQAVRDLSGAQDKLRMTEADLKTLADALDLQKRDPAAVAPPLPVPMSLLNEALVQDKGMQKHEQDLALARQRLADTESAFQPGSKSPILGQARDAVKAAEEAREKYRTTRLADFESQIREQFAGREKEQVAALRDAVSLSKRQVDQAKMKWDVKNKLINERNTYKTDLDGIEKQIWQTEKSSVRLADEMEQIKIELGVPARVNLSEEPSVARGVEGNRRMKYTLLAMAGVLAVGLIGVVAWEFRGRRVTGATDIASELGLRLIGTVPPLPTGEGTPDGGPPPDEYVMVEALDTIQAMLLHGGPGHAAPRTLLVTSAVAREGKTTLSGHLAISFARAGFRTLLVDGDMRSPTAQLLFGVPDAPGLSEVLRDEATSAAAIRATAIPGLSVLPAGVWTAGTRQALAGTRWPELKRELEAGFDYVVVDSGPVLFVTDTLQLARSSDAVVLSVLVGTSQVGNVAETTVRLRAVGAKLTGAIVNGVRTVGHSYGYSYGYGKKAAPAVAARVGGASEPPDGA